MLSHPNRKDQVHVFSLDGVLVEDVRERIACDPRTRPYEVIAPENGGDVAARIDAIEAMAKATVNARLLILDVRSYTLPRLQHAYNKIVGYNRRDLNVLCYTLLIGDGPRNLFRAGRFLEVFLPHLAGHRIDYHPAVFFYDPFLHYTSEEKPVVALENATRLPEDVPRRLAGAFRGGRATLEDVRRYFRAASEPANSRQRVMKRRQKKLTRLFNRRIGEEFPHHAERAQSWLSRAGYDVAGEVLRLHLYPLFFEDWVWELLSRTH